MGTALAAPVQGTALVVPRRSIGLMKMIAPPAQQLAAQEEVRKFVAEVLQEGRDYGVIPGTEKKGGKDRKVMLKPGAERTVIGFGCYFGEPELMSSEVDHDREVVWLKRKKKWNNRTKEDKTFEWQEERGTSLGLYRYVVRVPVIHQESGQVVGVGVGVCSTMESKYIDRPRDSENTVLKMAHKRALVAACLLAFGLSDQFTQDVEEKATVTAAGEVVVEEEEALPPMTLELALKEPFPWKKPEKYSGKPLAELTDRMLAAVEKWCEDQLQQDEDPYKERLYTAVTLIQESRAGKATAVEAAPAAPASPTASATSSTSAPATSPSSSPTITEAEPTVAELQAAGEKAAAATPADDSIYALTRRISDLLDNPKVPPSTRDYAKQVIKDGNGANTTENVKAMHRLIARIQRDIDGPPKASDLTDEIPF